jgi:protein TonB
MFDNLRKWLDFDDLLFNSRNREYGAYQLRKKYNSVMFAGVVMASLLFSAAVIMPFILTPHSDNVLNGSRRFVQVTMENFEPPAESIIVPPVAPPPEAHRIEEIVKYVPPVVVDSLLPLDSKLATTDLVLSQSESDNQNGTGIVTEGDNLSGQDGTETDEPFFMVEIMPSFKGGDINKFREWVMRRTNYPQEAIDKKISGKVYITFIVEADGAVSNVTVVKGVDPIIDNEAVKSIQSSPKWTPGFQRGQPVRVRYSIGLRFEKV